jgi:N-acetyl-alpha-D-glucosaminyl L-malate synthase BshA
VCYASLGGSGIMASELAVGLARRGHAVHVIMNNTPSRPLPECPRLTLHIVPLPTYALFEQAPYTLALANCIARVCAQEQIDVLHVHYAVPHTASAYLARQMLGARAPCLMTTLHGTDVTHVGNDPSYQAITRFCVESSDAISTPSEFLRERAHTQLGVARARAIEVIPNGVDAEQFAPAELRDPRYFDSFFDPAADGGGPNPTLFHVSNFRAVKRTYDLVDVLMRVREHVPARLVLIGDGPERAATAARAVAFGLGHALRFLGQMPRFREHLCQADAFLLTSESESFGVAALEALSCGIPVLGYRVGGLDSVVSEAVGQLVPAFDRDALAAATVRVLRDAAFQRSLASAARQRVLDHFRLEPMLEQYERAFHRALTPRVGT